MQEMQSLTTDFESVELFSKNAPSSNKHEVTPYDAIRLKYNPSNNKINIETVNKVYGWAEWGTYLKKYKVKESVPCNKIDDLSNFISKRLDITSDIERNKVLENVKNNISDFLDRVSDFIKNYKV